jgi:Txe/YoeB family toxin of Txe-Axe toxin-antitoxin module
MNVTFHQNAFEEYRQWAKEDLQIFAKINSLITDEYRLMYQVSGEQLIIASCKFHYSK